MPYASADEIAEEFKSASWAASGVAITETRIERFIDEAGALIDSTLASRYEVPITGTGALMVVKMICIWIVKARLLSILSVKTPQDKAKQDPDGPTLLKQALDMLKDIKNGKIELTDAVLANSSGGLTSFLKDEDIEHEFHVDEQDW